MSNCGSCKHWDENAAKRDWRLRINLTLLPGEEESHRYQADTPLQQRTARAEQQYGRCSKIGLLNEFDEISEDDLPLAFTKDASEYKADLYTKAEFGCVLYEEKC